MSLEPLDKMEKSNNNIPLLFFGMMLVFFVFAALLMMTIFEREKPQIIMKSDIARFGLSKVVTVDFLDKKSGIRSIEVVLLQDNKRAPVFQKQFPRQGYFSGVGPNRTEESFTVNTRSLGFRDGVAEMVVTVKDFSWWMLLLAEF